MSLSRIGFGVFSVASFVAGGVACNAAFAQTLAPEASTSDVLLRWEALVRERFTALIAAIPRVLTDARAAGEI